MAVCFGLNRNLGLALVSSHGCHAGNARPAVCNSGLQGRRQAWAKGVVVNSKRQGYFDYEDDSLGYLDYNYAGNYSEILDTSRDVPFYTPSRRPAGMRSMADDYMDDIYPEDILEEEEDFPEPDPEPVPRFVNGKQLYINKEIKAQVVRLLGGEGGKEMLGVKPFSNALALARDLDVDLVLLNSETNPPLCRLVDWSKYKFEVEKTNKQKAAKSANVETKEVRLRPKTDSNDLNTKLKSALKFLAKGNKVKVLMKFEGRELQYKDQGKEMLLRFIDEVGEAGKVDGPLNFKTSTYTVQLAPTGKAPGSSSSKEGGGSTSTSSSSQSTSGSLPPLPPTSPQAQQPQQQQAQASSPPPPPNMPTPPPPPPQSAQVGGLCLCSVTWDPTDIHEYSMYLGAPYEFMWTSVEAW
ncbi:translation initiation factor IF-3, C-terminal domain-containing protein [Dunaliella salina]|uniref:Translation initiation factor IF-3, C-terminal domain-containing protein n=1 Tax=Dunaliella salina TaxID=3046 RepID=A0ABQ7GQG2_DUNSA|nr:translation initiation factor IF-3, C-terminal domain-containing protein [Dunaliella salina]|eukprot:KAF5836842.1 translation initiation factor IF-3, C-terminal domain-containing protein [Dunaliella salina]